MTDDAQVERLALTPVVSDAIHAAERHFGVAASPRGTAWMQVVSGYLRDHGPRFAFRSPPKGLAFAFVLRWCGLTVWKATVAELAFPEGADVGQALVEAGAA